MLFLEEPCSISLLEAQIIPSSLFLGDLWSIQGHGSAFGSSHKMGSATWKPVDFPPIPEKSRPWDLNSVFSWIFPAWNCWEAAATSGCHQVCKHGIFIYLTISIHGFGAIPHSWDTEIQNPRWPLEKVWPPPDPPWDKLIPR